MVKSLTRYNGNFVNCQIQTAEAGQRMATAREGMLDRIAQSSESHYKSRGGWHPEGTARIDGVNYWCLGDFAPTTHYAQRTLDANRNSRYLSLIDDIKLGDKPAYKVIKQIAKADAKKLAEKKRVLVPSNQSNVYIVRTEDLGDVDVVRFLARSPKLAQKYGNFLKNKCGITALNIYQLSGNENIAAGFWLCRLGDRDSSDFGGYGRNFYIDDGSMFGVRVSEANKASVEDASKTQKILRPSFAQLRKYTLPFIAPNQKREFLAGLESVFRQQ